MIVRATWRAVLLTLATGIACSPSVGAVPATPPTAAKSAPVWVNLDSGVYHCPGTTYYGNTTRGSYLTEAEARSRGFRPNGGRPCSPGSDTATGTAPTALPDSSPPAPPESLTTPCTIKRVEDGDTIECESQGRVRLVGIDAPERDQEPFGSASTAGTAALLPPGTTIRLETDLEARDRYGRLLAYVWRDGRMVNWLLVRRGLAYRYRYPPNLRYAAWFDAAEARAASDQHGFWTTPGLRCRPVDHRRRRC